jgi:hypothetical protein
VREVVVITREAVEFAATVRGGEEGHAAPVGSPEQLTVYESTPTSVSVKVADDPAATVCEVGEALKADGLPFETFRTVLPPSKSSPVSGGPNGATMM